MNFSIGDLFVTENARGIVTAVRTSTVNAYGETVPPMREVVVRWIQRRATYTDIWWGVHGVDSIKRNIFSNSIHRWKHYPAR